MPKSLSTLVIALFSILTALTARRTVVAAICALSDSRFYVLGIIIFPITKLKWRI